MCVCLCAYIHIVLFSFLLTPFFPFPLTHKCVTSFSQSMHSVPEMVKLSELSVVQVAGGARVLQVLHHCSVLPHPWSNLSDHFYMQAHNVAEMRESQIHNSGEGFVGADVFIVVVLQIHSQSLELPEAIVRTHPKEGKAVMETRFTERSWRPRLGMCRIFPNCISILFNKSIRFKSYQIKKNLTFPSHLLVIFHRLINVRWLGLYLISALI